jgi:hypothetical protein
VRPRSRHRATLLVVLGSAACAAALTPAVGRADPLPSAAAADKLASDASLTGEEIYQRVQRNRLEAYVQHARLVSGDRGANDQTMRIRVTWKSYRDDQDQPIGGTFSKTLIRYDEPFDVRFTSYLIVDNADRVNDQFVYLPSRRRVRRVNLRGESMLGTDFSFEDVVPREAEGATHRRLPDEVHEGIPCFVVEAIPKPEAGSDYSRFVLSVEKTHYVPLRTRYWDGAGVEIKELRADPASIQQFENAWIPLRARMRHLVQETWTSLEIEKLEANPPLEDNVFEVRRLESH